MKLLNKLKRTKASAETKPARITTKTVEQHRREILDSAKKFKYPVQYEKHRLVINATLVVLVFVVVFFATILWRIYRSDDTGVFIYKISQVIPFPIGKIEDESILLSDYLAYYRSSWHYHQAKEQKNTDKDIESKLQAEYKQQAFDNAAKMAYAKKLARQHQISISQAEIDEDLQLKLSYADTKISQGSFDKIVKEYYGLSQWEYRQIFVYYPLLLKKVLVTVDQSAKQLEQQISTTIQRADGEFALASLKDSYQDKGVEFIDSGVVKYRLNDSGRSEVASRLEPGQVSPSFISRNLDSYNLIQLIAKDEETLRYHVLKIPLKQFEQQFKELTDSHKINKYIKY